MKETRRGRKCAGGRSGREGSRFAAKGTRLSLVGAGLPGLLLAGCGGGGVEPPTPGAPLTVAVLMPLPGGAEGAISPDMSWALDNINAAGGPAGRPLRLERIEPSPDALSTQAEQLANDDRYVAVIGPPGSALLADVADLFLKAQKPIVSFTSTAADLLRAYGGSGAVWRTRQSDIAQTELLIRFALEQDAHKVNLLTSLDDGGYTFFAWFGFFAAEYGLTTDQFRVVTFDADDDDCQESLLSALDPQPDILFVAPGTPEDIRCVASHLPGSGAPRPRVFFADTGLDPYELLQLEVPVEGLEGVTSAGDENYQAAFSAHFGNTIYSGPHGPNEYDAVLLLAYGLEVSGGQGGKALIEGMKAAVDGRDGHPLGWDAVGFVEALEALRQGKHPDLTGATGALQFESDLYMDLTSSKLVHWSIHSQNLIYDKTYDTGEEAFLTASGALVPPSPEGANAPSSSTWSPASEKRDTWALVAALSSGFDNYRHQSDALRQYQLLRAYGIPDDHIVLILADDIARNEENPAPSTVRNEPGGDDLYYDVGIDYRLGLTGEQLGDVLTGTRSDDVPIVLEPDAESNLYIYLVGHGGDYGIPVGATSSAEGLNGEGVLFSPTHLREALCTLQRAGRLRRTLVVIESCYAGVFGDSQFGGMGAGCEESEVVVPLHGTVLVTAARSGEVSYAGEYDTELGVWVNDEFSQEFATRSELTPTINLFDLYVDVFQSVPGSHVTLFSTSESGDIGSLPLAEFITP